MKIEQKFLTTNQYSRPSTKIGTIKQVVVHWVANPGTAAINNRNYFEGLKAGKKDAKGNYIYASSHYIIGLAGEIIQCVPESEVAYHANQANRQAIGIENCHPDWNGQFNPKTYESLIKLLADICTRHNLDPMTGIIRHHDVTGKDCPKYYIQNPAEWEKLKNDVKKEMSNQPNFKNIKLNIHGKLTEVQGVYFNNINYVPIRVLERLGYEIDWDKATETVLIDYARQVK